MIYGDPKRTKRMRAKNAAALVIPRTLTQYFFDLGLTVVDVGHKRLTDPNGPHAEIIARGVQSFSYVYYVARKILAAAGLTEEYGDRDADWIDYDPEEEEE